MSQGETQVFHYKELEQERTLADERKLMHLRVQRAEEEAKNAKREAVAHTKRASEVLRMSVQAKSPDSNDDLLVPAKSAADSAKEAEVIKEQLHREREERMAGKKAKKATARRKQH